MTWLTYLLALCEPGSVLVYSDDVLAVTLTVYSIFMDTVYIIMFLFLIFLLPRKRLLLLLLLILKLYSPAAVNERNQRAFLNAIFRDRLWQGNFYFYYKYIFRNTCDKKKSRSLMLRWHWLTFNKTCYLNIIEYNKIITENFYYNLLHS